MKKILMKLIWLIFLVPGIYLSAIWHKLPATVPVHFNLAGEVDRYGSRNELVTLVLILTAVNIVVYLLFTNIYRIDRMKYAQENRNRLQSMAFVLCVFISAVLCTIIYSVFRHPISFFPGLIFSGVGLLFCFMGNYMHNIKPNYFAGFRLPWTLGNEDNWRKTHLLGGKLFFAGGLLIVAVCLLTPVLISIVAFLIITFTLVIIPVVYSYRLYKKQKSFS